MVRAFVLYWGCNRFESLSTLLLLLLLLLLLASHPSLGIGHIITDLSPLGSIGSQIRDMPLPKKLQVFSAEIESSHYQFLACFFEVTLIGKSHSSRGSLPVCWWIIQENDSGEPFRIYSQGTWPRYFHFL